MTIQTNLINKEKPKFKLGIYAHPTTPISSIAGIWDIFSVAKKLSATDLDIEISIIGTTHFSQYEKAEISLNPSTPIKDTNYNLIIIAGIGPIPEEGVRFNPKIISWLKECSNNGGAIASVCTGAFLLASTGFLDHRKATTHWSAAGQFKDQFPKVKLSIENMLTHDGPFFCSGGAYAFQDLCVYLIDSFFGRALAETCASLLMIELTKRSQLTFAGLQALKIHNDKQILSIQNWLEDNLNSSENINEIATRFNMSPRNFVRRFKAATNEVPSNYIQKLRIEKAKYLLESSTKTIDTIAYSVGYQDVQYFRRLFKKISGMTPSNFRYSKAPN